MKDQRRRRPRPLDALIERVIADALAAMPPEQRRESERKLREGMGKVLSEAPLSTGNAVSEMALRAALASAFNVKFTPE